MNIDKIKKELLGSILFILGFMILVSQFSYNPTEEPTISSEVAINNIFGIFGVYIAHYLMKMFIGWGSLSISIIIIITGALIFFQPKYSFEKE